MWASMALSRSGRLSVIVRLAAVDLVPQCPELRPHRQRRLTVTRAWKEPSLFSRPTSLIPRKNEPGESAVKRTDAPTWNGDPLAPTLPIRESWPEVETTLRLTRSGRFASPSDR